jgi:hypothetical protein
LIDCSLAMSAFFITGQFSRLHIADLNVRRL